MSFRLKCFTHSKINLKFGNFKDYSKFGTKLDSFG